jgi:hypothetical protein
MTEASTYSDLTFDGTGVVMGPWEGDGGVQQWLASNGYEPGYVHNPDAWVDGYSIDKNVAETTPCPKCGKVAGRFEAYTNAEIHSYGMAVAICGVCDFASTF